MINTTLLTAVTVGVTAAPTSNPVKTSLQAATTAYSMHASLTNGAKSGNNQKKVVLWHAVSPFSITTAQAVVQLLQQARRFEIIPHTSPGNIQITKSDMFQADGGFHYIWTEEPLLDIAATLTVVLTEM